MCRISMISVERQQKIQWDQTKTRFTSEAAVVIQMRKVETISFARPCSYALCSFPGIVMEARRRKAPTFPCCALSYVNLNDEKCPSPASLSFAEHPPEMDSVRNVHRQNNLCKKLHSSELQALGPLKIHSASRKWCSVFINFDFFPQ